MLPAIFSGIAKRVNGSFRPQRKVMRKLAWVATFLLMGEVAIRSVGMTDFPLFDVSYPDVGYVPKPSQSGAFMGKDWVFNERSMGVAAPFLPSQAVDVALIGNSIVMGGNPFSQAQRVGPLVQARFPTYKVWPIAAGGWSLPNQIAYLHHNPDVLPASDVVVWEYMTGGASLTSKWRGEYVFPTQRPVCALCYAFVRYVLPHVFPYHPDELPPMGPPTEATLQAWDQMLSTIRPNARKILLLYPTKVDLRKGSNWLPERASVEALAKRHGFTIVDISRQPEWDVSYYKSDQVHPLPSGNVALSRIIANAIQ